VEGNGRGLIQSTVVAFEKPHSGQSAPPAEIRTHSSRIWNERQLLAVTIHLCTYVYFLSVIKDIDKRRNHLQEHTPLMATSLRFDHGQRNLRSAWVISDPFEKLRKATTNLVMSIQGVTGGKDQTSGGCSLC